MDLLDIEFNINLPIPVINHMHLVLVKDDTVYAIPYTFCPAQAFKDFSIPTQFWSLQMTKYVICTMKNVTLMFQ